jgi:ribose 5-phosphate isomerase A
VTADALKRAAAAAAVDAEVRPGMRLGLGTGSTAFAVLDVLSERLAGGALRDLVGVPTSEATARRCRELGIPLATLAELPSLDLALDGADEIDPRLRLVKGLGGAHLREKVVARASRRMVVVADDSKLVGRLGERAPLPVEVIGFARPVCERLLSEAGWRPALRAGPDGTPFTTDEGNLILDCRRDDWSDPEALARDLADLPGVVEHGLFLGMAAAAVVATPAGVRMLEAPAGVPSR